MIEAVAANLLIGAGAIVHLLCTIASVAATISIVLSWVSPDPRNAVVALVHGAVLPLRTRVRRAMPWSRTGAVDWSPLFVIWGAVLVDGAVARNLTDGGRWLAGRLGTPIVTTLIGNPVFAVLQVIGSMAGLALILLAIRIVAGLVGADGRNPFVATAAESTNPAVGFVRRRFAPARGWPAEAVAVLIAGVLTLLVWGALPQLTYVVYMLRAGRLPWWEG